MSAEAFPVSSTVVDMRGAFGASTSAWAERVHRVDPHSWISISGATQPDYNLALVHGGDVAREVKNMIDVIRSEGIPSILMLAGRGLAGAQVLADAGWVCTGALPLMGRGPTDSAVDPDVRELTHDELPAGRALASNVFGLGSEMAELLFSDRICASDRTVLAGLFVDDELVGCGLLCRAPDLSTGWALAVEPGRRRLGVARRLTEAGFALDAAARGPRPMYFLATPMAQPLYEMLGFGIVEYWQTWSRPRWILGGA